ncbi:glycosyltransferase [Sulfitobacter sp. S190]|uniref:glycosyltransferase family 2 protein n=1 Tax=Sulfitobacter sp. S190 TaxID=2867022 RepID=UPI0021A3D5AA|nr:glycosyltransferase [Sulfitobacter sp. S190]UWR23517.1 glycosyltransferase [Sulfitobacter sp. S190]
MSVALSVIIPAHDEAGYIAACLEALLDSADTGADVEVIVVPNGCRDDTAAQAAAFADRFERKGWPLTVHVLAEGGKMGALNAADAVARHAGRVYLDADVTVTPPLLAQLAQVLDTKPARYASGTPQIAQARSAVTHAYARFWRKQPFVTDGVPGFGVFAVNAAGRARWALFPDIISDDTFVRLNFTPQERHRVAAHYTWPMIEGFGPLVRVRRRQDAGVQEIAQRFPELMANADPHGAHRVPLWRRVARAPWGFVVYAAVALAVRLPHRKQARWARGR